MTVFAAKHAAAFSGSALAVTFCLMLARLGAALQVSQLAFEPPGWGGDIPSSDWLQRNPDGQYNRLFMRHMPKFDLVVCAPGKVGSTTLYRYIYRSIFGKDWDTSKESVQNIKGKRWRNQFETVRDPGKQDHIMKKRKALTFALIRDPKERLISAWKSKISCEMDVGFIEKPTELKGTDAGYRPIIIGNLKALLGSEFVDSSQGDCLTLEDFLKNLEKAHEMGKQSSLDEHIYPQDLACFKKYPPGNWTVVTEVDKPGAFDRLAERLGNRNSTLSDDHSSTDHVRITHLAARLLDLVTRDEYAALEGFLTRKSKVKAGRTVLMKHYRPGE